MMAFMMVSCNLFDKDCRAIMGEYVSNDYQTLTDGIPCDVMLETSENFELFSFRNKSNMKLDFHFDETFEFPSLMLEYNMEVDGKWRYSDSTLTVDIDTLTFKYEFVGSSAKTPIEESMVRQLKKNVVLDDLMPKMRKRIIESSQRSAHVYDINEESIILKNPLTNRAVMIRRISD